MKAMILFFALSLAAVSSSAQEPDEINIGVILPLSGPMAVESDHVSNALVLAVDEINESGKLGSAKMDFVVVDDSLTPTGSVAALQYLIDQHDIQIVLGPATSSSTLAIIPMINQAGIVALGPTSTSVGLSAQSEYLFRVPLTNDKSLPIGVKIAKERLGFKRVAIIHNAADEYSRSSNKLLMAALDSYPDVSVISEQSYLGDPTAEAADYDLAEQVASIKEAAPDVIISSGLPEDQHAVLVAVHEAGIRDVPFFLSQASIDEVGRISAEAPEAAENIIATTPWIISSQNASSQAFVAAFEKRFGEAPGDFAAQMHASVHILGDALVRAVDYSAASVRDALAMTKDLETVLGPFSFDENGDAIYDPIIVEVQDGKFVELEPSTSQ